jgi:Protein of unknown function (DUF2530)
LRHTSSAAYQGSTRCARTVDRAPAPGRTLFGVPTTESRKLEPPDLPMVPFALGGMGVWILAGLVLLPFRNSLAAHGHGEWIRICVAGFLLGFPGLFLMLVHDANRRRRRAAATPRT